MMRGGYAVARRFVEFDDSFQAASRPIDQPFLASGFLAFASDAAYAAFKTAAAATVANGDAYYNTADHVIRYRVNGAWETVGQPGVSGSPGAPITVADTAAIPFTGKRPEHVVYVAGSGGPATVSGIGSGAFIGQRLKIVGTHDTNVVVIENGVAIQNGDVTLKEDVSISYEWNGTDWREDARNDLE
jgi:hypothetical protein